MKCGSENKDVEINSDRSFNGLYRSLHLKDIIGKTFTHFVFFSWQSCNNLGIFGPWNPGRTERSRLGLHLRRHQLTRLEVPCGSDHWGRAGCSTQHTSLKSWNGIWHSGGTNWSQWSASSSLDLQSVQSTNQQSDRCQKHSDHPYLCKESFSRTDAPDTTCSRQTTRRCSWTETQSQRLCSPQNHEGPTPRCCTSDTLYGRCRGRAGARWCLPAAAHPGRWHIHLCPSSGRPLEDKCTARAWEGLPFR